MDKFLLYRTSLISEKTYIIADEYILLKLVLATYK